MHPEFKFVHSPEEGITIGYRINDAESVGGMTTVTFAEAFTSPRDTFSKAIGRKVVEGRIRKGGNRSNGHPRAQTVPLALIGGSTRYRDISKQLLAHARARIDVAEMYRNLD